MSNIWYYAKDDRQIGPVTLEALQSLARTGQLRADDLVWADGMPEWLPANKVAEIWQQPTATPVAPPPGISQNQPAQITSPRYAGFWIRFVAIIIDGLLISIAVGILSSFIGATHTGMFVVDRHVRSFNPTDGFRLSTILIEWLYFAFMESSATQATLGKMALGLKVIDRNGQRISFGRATGRYFAKWISWIILAIGFIMAGFDPRKQALHDKIAGTFVVHK